MKNLEAYRRVYRLSTLSYRENVKSEFFKSCKDDHDFVTVCIFNEKGEIFLFRDFCKNIGWELPGGYIKAGEKIEDAVNRVVLRETGLSVNELEPIFILKNTFCYKDKCKNHSGIVFLAMASGDIENSSEYIQKIFTKVPPLKMAYQDKKIINSARVILGNKVYDIPYNEIKSVKKHFRVHVFHKLFMQKIGNFASIKIKEDLKTLIIGSPQIILDVSCGDDCLIFDLEKRFPDALCFANDISWKAISLLRNKFPQSNVIFTNHNALNLPFRDKFDLVIFKNSLHHIPSENQIQIVYMLGLISRQLIICDIDNPKESDLLAKLWHWYYVKVMDDCGDSFNNFKQFQTLVKNNIIRNKAIKFGKIKTIKGDYMYASIIDNGVIN